MSFLLYLRLFVYEAHGYFNEIYWEFVGGRLVCSKEN